MCGKPLVVEGVTFKHFTVREIVDKIGEDEYSSAVNMFIAKPSDLMVELYDSGLDYREVKMYDVFMAFFIDSITRKDNKVVLDEDGLPKWNADSVSSRRMGILTGIPDFMFTTDGESCFLTSKSTGLVIDESTYNLAKHYYMKMHFVSSEEKYNPGNKETIKFLVREEKRRREREARRERKSQFAKGISALVWSSGFTHNQILDLHLYQYFDGIERVGRIQEYNNLCSGYFSGNIAQKDFKSAVEKVYWAG